MAQRIDDRWLWLGVGAAAFFAVKGIQYALSDLVRLTEIDPYQYEPKKQKEDHPEDTLSVADLRVLADSPHPNIANAAISLAISRLARMPHATQMVAKDLASKDTETVRRAHGAVHFLRNHESVPFDARNGSLPLEPPGYVTPTHWSDTMSNPDEEDGRISPLAGLRDELLGPSASDVIVPSIENPVAGWEDVPRQRTSHANRGGGDDADARRRRREAMVLHEGGGAVTRGDIIRPRDRT